MGYPIASQRIISKNNAPAMMKMKAAMLIRIWNANQFMFPPYAAFSPNPD